MLVTAVFGVILPFFLTLWAQIHLTSATTAVLMAVMPLMVITLAHFFVPGERLSTAKLVGFAVGFTGIVLVIDPGPSVPGGSMPLLASIAVLGAALSYSGTSVYARLNSTASPAAMAAGMLLIASVLTSPLLVTVDTGAFRAPASLPVAAMLAIVVLGVFATGLASVLYFRVVGGPGPSFLALVNYIVPAWGVLLGVTLLDESLSPLAIAGLLLILGGVALSEFGHRWHRQRSALNGEHGTFSNV